MKVFALAVSLLISTSAMAGGYVTPAVPTKIDVVRGDGFMIYGAFANPGGCTFANQIFVKSDHPQYKQIYAAALAAYAGKFKVSAYVHGCETLLWYSAAPDTFNAVYSSSSLAISD